MRALSVPELGKPPVLGEVDSPTRGDGESLIEMSACALNPVDVAISAGRFFGGSPPPPYVPGCEGVGRVLEGAYAPGERVWIQGHGVGISRDGTLAERVSVPQGALFAVPADVSDEVACALGIAGLAGWMPLSWRLPVHSGDRVLVLGATSTVGLVAVQAAKLLGAARVVAAGRRPERLRLAAEYGADATVVLDSGEGLAAAYLEAFGGERPTYVVDALWGPPLVAALEVGAPGVRVVQIGQSAATEATIPSNFVRGRQAEIVGFTIFAVPAVRVAEEYAKLLGHAAAGRMRLEVETYPFERAPEAWARQASGPAGKLVVTFP